MSHIRRHTIVITRVGVIDSVMTEIVIGVRARISVSVNVSVSVRVRVRVTHYQ